jgi:DNA-binding transcriptional ArsR family regulator
MTRQSLSRRLKALADPMRLRILALLPVGDRCEDVYNVSELAKETGITQPSVSHHLRVLRAARLVQSKRMCHDVYYWIDSREIDSVQKSLGDIAVR